MEHGIRSCHLLHAGFLEPKSFRTIRDQEVPSPGGIHSRRIRSTVHSPRAALDIPGKDFIFQITVISPLNRKWLLALFLLLLYATFLFVLLGKPPALPEVMILPSTTLAVKSGRVPDRWIPANWVWLRWACRFGLGVPRRVGVQDVCGYDSNTVASILAQNSLGKPDAEGGGLALWILPGRTLQPPDGAPYHAVSGSVVEDDQRKSGITLARG